MDPGAEREVVTQQLRGEIQEICEKILEMLHIAWEAFRRQDLQPLNRADDLGREIHQRERELTRRIPERLGAGPGIRAQAEFSFLPMHLERVDDNVEALVRAIRETLREGIPLSERAMKEVHTLFEKVIELMECMRDAIGTKNKVLIRHIIEEGRNYERMVNEFALFHQERLIEGLCAPKASHVYLAILDYLKGIESHVRQMAKKLS